MKRGGRKRQEKEQTPKELQEQRRKQKPRHTDRQTDRKEQNKLRKCRSCRYGSVAHRRRQVPIHEGISTASRVERMIKLNIIERMKWSS